MEPDDAAGAAGGNCGSPVVSPWPVSLQPKFNVGADDRAYVFKLTQKSTLMRVAARSLLISPRKFPAVS